MAIVFETRNDIRLAGRAMVENWNVDRSAVVSALMKVMASSEDKLKVEAAKALLKADELNVKREAISQKHLSDESDRKLQLLELAKRIPIGTIAQIASDNGISPESGSAE